MIIMNTEVKSFSYSSSIFLSKRGRGRWTRTSTTVVAAMLLTSCATTFEPPPLAANHPANPNAMETPRARPPRLMADDLTRKTTALLASKEPQQSDYKPADPHAGHDMSGMKGMDESKAYWTCPMHPEIHADKPGQCPKCGMTLVKTEGAAQ